MVGDVVTLHRVHHAKCGTWKRYEGRSGVVIALNPQDAEVLVRVEGAGYAWFRADEWQLK